MKKVLSTSIWHSVSQVTTKLPANISSTSSPVDNYHCICRHVLSLIIYPWLNSLLFLTEIYATDISCNFDRTRFLRLFDGKRDSQTLVNIHARVFRELCTYVYYEVKAWARKGQSLNPSARKDLS